MCAIRNPDIKYTKIFINNQWLDSSSGETFPTINPVNGETLCEIQRSGEEEVEMAVEAAKKAFKPGSKWRTLDASKRGLLIHKFANLVERDLNYLASLETLDNGKPFFMSLIDIRSALGVFRYYAGQTDKNHGKTIPADGSNFTYTKLEPVGICAAILPWNVPILMASHKLGPALGAGCVSILKPAEQTPLTALYLASLFKEAGFPPGVVNVLPGYGDVGELLTKHMHIDKVSFTGSTEVGQIIQENAGKTNCKRVTLETGGKSPLAILPDCNLEEAVQIAHLAVFNNQGQVCCSGTRTFVHEDIYDDFVQKSKELALQRKLGDPFDEDITQGPQIDEDQFNKILSYLEIGKEEGATVECGGDRVDGPGYYIQPTVFSNVEDDMRIAREEIFGPVQQILKFNTLDDLIQRANDTCYGLAAGIFTNDMNTILTYSHGVRAGTLWVNCWYAFNAQTPFGGFKMSGLGREYGTDGILPYLEVKTVSIQVPKKNS